MLLPSEEIPHYICSAGRTVREHPEVADIDFRDNATQVLEAPALALEDCGVTRG